MVRGVSTKDRCPLQEGTYVLKEGVERNVQLLQQNTRGWVAYKQQKFTAHSSGGWKSEVSGSVVR